MLDATERRALTFSTFAAACICFAPAEIVSGVALLLASLALMRWDGRVTAREEAELAASAAAACAGGAHGETTEGTPR
jgi:hypothetical protein